MKKVFKKMSGVIASGLMLFAVACSVDSSDDSSTAPSVNTGSGPSVNPEDNSETEKNGAVSIAASVSKVTVTFRDADYDGKNDDVVVTLVQGQNSNAEIPDWSRAGYELTGWTSSVEGLTVKTALSKDVTFTAEWTKYCTVTFKDSEVAGLDTNEDVTQKILETAASKTASVPSWAKTGYTLSWESSVDGLTVESEITEGVTFTAKWTARTAYTVTFKDNENGNADVTEKVYEGDKPANVPSWTKEHYTLSWESSVDGVTVDSEITQSVTFAAKWTEHEKFTVTFKDADGGTNADDVQTVYINEKAVVPSWAKEGYKLTWISSVDGLTADSAITSDVTFTAVWKEIPIETVITFVDSSGSFTTKGTPEGYAIGSGSKDYGKSSHATYTSDSGTKVDVRYGVKLNKTGNIILTLDATYTVLLVQGTDKTTANGLNIATLGNDGSTYGDAKNYAVVSTGSNVVSAKLDAGTYKITKGDSETSVFAVILQK